MQYTEKVRVYALAKMLNMESKALLEMCQKAGISAKNQLSCLEPEQCTAIEQMVKRGSGGVATAPPPVKPVTPQVIQDRVRVIEQRRSRPAVRPPAPVPTAPPTPVPAEVRAAPIPTVSVPVEPTALGAAEVEPPTPADLAPTAPVGVAEVTPAEVIGPPQLPEVLGAVSLSPPVTPAPLRAAPAVTETAETGLPKGPVTVETPLPPVKPEVPLSSSQSPDLREPQAPVAGPEGAQVGTLPPPETSPTPPPRPILESRPRDLSQRSEGEPRRPTRRERTPKPVFVHRAQPPTLKKARPVEEKKQQPVLKVQTPIAPVPEHLQVVKGGPIKVEDLLRKPGTPVVVPDEEEDDTKDKKGSKKPGGVAGRAKRHEERAKRAEARKGRENEKHTVLGTEDEETLRRSRTGLRKRLQQKRTPITVPRKGKVPIAVPITVRSLSEALGVRSAELLFKLRDHAINAPSLNLTLEPDLAETIALDYGAELDIKRPHDAEEQLVASLKKQDAPEDLMPRAPIVTIMGHVDHGKTSLLDHIRQSNVVATEAGHITQVIRAWRVERDDRPVTFLDTPGHEAFTKMRARGAQVTDIAVIVVAADDGVMPQTEEAINHARAAGVSLVVAINKVDLPAANVNRTRQQLYGLDVLPDNMGGDVPFVETSATTGKGVDELLDMLSVVAELKELKANPKKPAEGTCLEAMLDEGEGVLATLLIQNGSLHRGDILLCGATFGRVRAMYDDLGHLIQEAGPSVPVRITGLNAIPNADDPFQVVPDLVVAREIAEKRGYRTQEITGTRRLPVSLESLAETKIAELKVILKADFRGSVEAIRKELEKLEHKEVRARVLHTGIGGITENDVQLALTSPQDTIVVGFNVVPDDRARALAEERGIKIREYDIIYKLTDDVRAALEGKLKPREEVVHLGRAIVRETFKISRVGTIAGCYVTQGSIERSAKARVIREGVVVYPPADRTVGLESLKRFKEDVREVREGFECGMKIAGYDDIKVGDVIEAYRVEQIQRTLDK